MEVRVLGAVEFVSEAGPVDLPHQQRRLLAALATRVGETRSVDALLDAMWGSRQPASGAKALQIYVSRLRRALGSAAVLRTTGEGYALDLEAMSIDALRFEQLLAEGRQALASANPALARSRLQRGLGLWRGAAYGEFAYEQFARFEAERLEELRMVAWEELIAAELALGCHGELLPEIRRLALEHPTRERLQAQSMLALYRCGRHSEALEVFSATRVRLREELGLEPSPELRALERRILQHDPGLAPPPSLEDGLDLLPNPPNEMIGRRRELDELRDLLVRREARLIVLTGVGGSGKTRLALEAARQTAAWFANGAAFVDLSALRDPALVMSTIARVVDVNLAPDREPLEALVEALRAREELLVLDNVEQLRSATSQFVDLLLQVPRLFLLVTSRVTLQLTGERVYPVEPLAPHDAAALFRQRAQEADARFALTAEEEQAIRRICERLDGLPLAIELAAKRTRALSPLDLLERLEPRLQLLTAGPRDRPARQRTLRATLEWSIELLPPEERHDLYRLSVFTGGCTLDGAEVVCGTTLDRLSSLVDHSLLRHDRHASGSRYGMLETIREFARAQLPDDEAAQLERQHAEYILELGEAAGARTGAAREGALQGLVPELRNLRAAMGWALQFDVGLALRLGWVGSLFQPTASELRLWLDRALARSGDAPASSRVRALHAAAHLAGSADETDRARHLWQQALTLYRDLGDDAGIARALAGLGVAASQEADYEAARGLYDESLTLYRSIGDRDGEWIVSNNLGELERVTGNYGRATELLERAVAIASDSGDSEAVAMSLHGLGDLALAQGEAALASARYRSAISVGAALAGGRRNLCWSLAALASIAGANGDVQRAGALWGAAESLEEQLRLRLPADARQGYRRPLDELEQEPLKSAVARGRTLTLDEAVMLALADATA